MLWLRSLIGKSNFIGDVFFPTKQPSWKDKLTALLPVIALPVAFWLWHWRDKNVRDQIAEQRNQVNDANLKGATFLNCRFVDPKGLETVDAAQAKFDSECKFFDTWEKPTKTEIKERKSAWVERGAIFKASQSR